MNNERNQRGVEPSIQQDVLQHLSRLDFSRATGYIPLLDQFSAEELTQVLSFRSRTLHQTPDRYKTAMNCFFDTAGFCLRCHEFAEKEDLPGNWRETHPHYYLLFLLEENRTDEAIRLLSQGNLKKYQLEVLCNTLENRADYWVPTAFEDEELRKQKTNQYMYFAHNVEVELTILLDKEELAQKYDMTWNELPPEMKVCFFIENNLIERAQALYDRERESMTLSALNSVSQASNQKIEEIKNNFFEHADRETKRANEIWKVEVKPYQDLSNAVFRDAACRTHDKGEWAGDDINLPYDRVKGYLAMHNCTAAAKALNDFLEQKPKPLQYQIEEIRVYVQKLIQVIDEEYRNCCITETQHNIKRAPYQSLVDTIDSYHRANLHLRKPPRKHFNSND